MNLENRQMGERNDTVKEKRLVFVTVGTTCFDALVRAVDTTEVKNELFKKGYTDILIQMGRGSYIPTKVLVKNLRSDMLGYVDLICVITESGYVGTNLNCLYEGNTKDILGKFDVSTAETGSPALDYFTFSSSIADYLKSASLVISHAGSGSIFETLRLGKPLIVVVNEDLMDNHQSELAEELAERKHLYCARPQTLYKTISDMDIGSLVPYQPGDAKPVAKLINRYLGFPDD